MYAIFTLIGLTCIFVPLAVYLGRKAQRPIDIDETFARMRYEREIESLYRVIYDVDEIPHDLFGVYDNLTTFELSMIPRLLSSKFCDKDRVISDVMSGEFKKVVDKYYTWEKADDYGFRRYYDKSEKITN